MLIEIGVLLCGIFSFFWVSKLGGGFILLGFLGYASSKGFTIHYINKKMPGLLNVDANLPPPLPGKKYLWESTAGTGIVPKWLSLLSFVGMGLTAVGLCVSVLALIFHRN